MARLPRFTLSHDERRDDWVLRNDATGRIADRFATKAEATAGGALAGAVGPQGGSVRIQLQNGRYQEERTYPPSADPRSSKG